MKIFISGPMSGKPNFNREAFFKAQEELEKLGYSVWNPAWLAYPSDTEFSKDAIYAIDNEALRHCDAIYMLKGWTHSDGAIEEHKIAVARDLTIMYESECCWSKRYSMNWKSLKPLNDCYSIYDYIGPTINDIDRKMNSRYADNLNKINALKKEVEAIKESIGTDNLQEQLEKDFADVYEEFQNTKGQVNDINMGYIKWSSEVSQFDERIEKLEENMKEIAANGGLGLSFNLMNERVSSNKRDISSIKNDIATIKDNIDNQRCTLDVISERVDKHYKKHNDNDDALEKRIKDMNERMSLFDRELDAYEEAYKQLRTSLDNNDNALERRIKALEKRLNVKPFYAPTDDEKDD